MTIQLERVLNDIMGATGQLIIRAIVAGERDVVVLAQQRNRACQTSTDTRAQALTGTWKPEQLFVLQQALVVYDVSTAQSVSRSDSAIGAFYRTMRACKGPQQATVATAHKIARIVDHLLRYGEAYEAESAETYDRKRQERELRTLTRRANKLGYTLAPVSEPTPTSPT